MQDKNKILTFDLNGIKECQRNRYPLLFIDKVTEAVPGKSAKAVKCFSYNEWFFPAHFENDPNVPGFILVECLVQAFLMSFLCIDKYKGNKTNFVSIDKVRFKKKIVPGDTMNIEANLNSIKRGIAKGYSKSFVNGELACSAEFVVIVPKIFNTFLPTK